MRRSFIVAAAAAYLVSWGSAQAHHSGAMFDRSREVTLVGTVKDFSWTNPHSSFAVEIMKADGSPELWAVEMNSPNNLVREGWTRYTLKPGDKVTPMYRPPGLPSRSGLITAVTLSPGLRV